MTDEPARGDRDLDLQDDLQRLIEAGALDDLDPVAMATATSATPIED